MTTEHSKKAYRMNTVGNYKFQGITLGKGNFATVVLATHKIIGAGVALKITNTAADVEEYVIRNLEREAKILAKLNHPNIVKLYETAMCNNLYCLALECIMGGDLGEHIRKQDDKRLSEADARILFHQLISAVGHMHKNGILHRDLKLENILMVNSHQLKLADFGLSNFYNPKVPLKTRCGSPEYAAPELFQADVAYGPAVDMWSAGVILYVMVVGAVPFVYPKKNISTVEGRRKLLHEKCCKGLVNEHFKAMRHVSKECQNLINGLLDPEQKSRIKLRDVEKHQWLKNGLILKQVEKDTTQSSQDLLHRTVLSRLAIRTQVPENELECNIQNVKFGKYYAMYHLLRDSMIKSGAPFKSVHSIHVFPQRQNKNLLQQLKNHPKETSTKVQAPINGNILESSVKPVMTCNQAALKPPTRNERTPSYPSSQLPISSVENSAQKLRETVEASSAKNNKKVKCRAPTVKGKVDTAGLGLPSNSRNVLLRSICEKQKNNRKELECKGDLEVQGNSRAQELCPSPGHLQENADRKYPPLANIEHCTSPLNCNTSMKAKVGQKSSSSTIKSTTTSKCESKQSLNHKSINGTSKSLITKTMKDSKGLTPTSSLIEHPESKRDTPQSAKTPKTQPQVSKTLPDTIVKRATVIPPVTILKRPSTAIKKTTKPPCTTTKKSLAVNTLTILKKPVVNLPLKQRTRTPYTSVIPTAQAMTEHTCGRHSEISNRSEGITVFAEELEITEVCPPHSNQAATQHQKNQNNVPSDWDDIKSVCPRCHKERHPDIKSALNNSYRNDQQHLSRDQRHFDESPVVKANNQGRGQAANATLGDVPAQKIVKAPTTADSRRDRFTSNVTNNRTTQYNSHTYRPSYTEGVCNVRGNVPDTRPGAQPVYSATYYRSGSSNKTMTINPSKPVNDGAQRNMCFTRTPGSSFGTNGAKATYSNHQRHGSVQQTRDTIYEHPCRGDGLEIKCYSCDTKFPSQELRRMSNVQGDRPVIKNAFGVHWA